MQLTTADFHFKLSLYLTLNSHLLPAFLVKEYSYLYRQHQEYCRNTLIVTITSSKRFSLAVLQNQFSHLIFALYYIHHYFAIIFNLKVDKQILVASFQVLKRIWKHEEFEMLPLCIFYVHRYKTSLSALSSMHISHTQ